MDSDSDSPFNYSWPSFPKMRMRKRIGKRKDKSQSLKEASSPTLSAAARLATMIHGKDGALTNGKQADDMDGTLQSPNEETSPGWNSVFSTEMSTASVPTEHRELRESVLTQSECPGSPPSPWASSPVFPSSPLASAFHLLEGQKRSLQTVSPRINGRGHSADRTRDLSPSLECDSEEEDILGHSYPTAALRKQSSLRSSSGEERDSFDTSPDFNHPHSDSNTVKEEAEVRLRSYSYSSPKAKPSRPQLNRDTSISDLSEGQRAFSLTESPKEKRIEDEEWDRYIIPSKAESEKYKVSRTFSFLKNRMSSTRSKTKVKTKETKEVKEKGALGYGHQFVPVSPSGSALCVACDKAVSGKELLHCSNCFLNVHKSCCRETIMPCVKRHPERNAVLMKSKTLSLPLSSAKDSSAASSFSSSSFSTTTKDKRETLAALSKSMSIDSRHLMQDKSVVEEESSASPGAKDCAVDEGTAFSLTPLSTEQSPVITQEVLEGPLLSDLSAELLGLDAESWSVTVGADFCRQLDRFTVKRQDVIYELMQTELHHIQTLSVMSEVFRRGMLEELQLDLDCVARVFPCLDPLLHFHKSLFGALQERRQTSANFYLIHNIGDILLQQFSEENAEKMKQMYGEFCSHHKEAVNNFKDLQQQNKKLQMFVKQQSNNALVKRREVPEFILLVTQRITKYPVLLERILQYTKEGSQEYCDLSKALVHIRDVITAVDTTVNTYDKSQELQEVLTRLENKSTAKLKNGKVFTKQDLYGKHRVLHQKGLVYWKTATGRLKDTLALLLTDVLVFLQEKDQRFTFAAVDQKPPVIPLQKLIVREVANEERGMFLISASSVGPEMYEVHTVSRDERNSWMKQIRQAVESCPEEEEEEERNIELEGTRRATEARFQKISQFQETLLAQDQLICNSLEEKLELYAELTELSLGSPQSIPHRHLVVQADCEAPGAASTLLTAALKEAENLTSILQGRDSSCVQPTGLDISNSNSSIQELPSEPDYLSTLSISSSCVGSDSDLAEGWNNSEPRRGEDKSTMLKVAESVQSLTQLLYSLQATVNLQDSCSEIQKLLLQEEELLPLRGFSSLHNTEQDKQKTSEKKREEVEKNKEVDEVQKLHLKLKHEQQRWDKECLAREKQQSDQETVLRQREQQCLLEVERLRSEREEFEAQLLEYQQNMERLKEGQRSVEREKEKIEAQQRLLQTWRHSRQSSLPVTIPVQSYQGSSHSRSGSLDGNTSVYETKKVLLTTLQQSHLYQPTNNHHQCPPKRLQNGPLNSSGFSTNIGLTASLYNSLNTLLSQAHGRQIPDHMTYANCTQGPPQPESIHTFSHRAAPLPPKPAGFSPPLLRQSLGSWSSEVTSDGLYEDDYSSSPSLTPLLPPQAYLSLEGPDGDEGGEENIVYL